MRIYSWKKPELTITQTTGGSLVEGTTYYLYARFRYTTGEANATCASQSPRTDVIPITITAGNSAFLLNWKTSGNITAYASGGTGVTIVTSAKHCLDTGNVVTIPSGVYAGTYTITWLSYNTFSIPITYSATEISSWESSSIPNKTGTGLLISLDTVPQFDSNGYWSYRSTYQYNIVTQGIKISVVPTGNLYQAEHKSWRTTEVQAKAYICSAFDYDTYGFPWFEITESAWSEANLNTECLNSGYPMVGIFSAGYSKVFNMPFNFNAPNLSETTLTGYQVNIKSGSFNAPNLTFKLSNINLEALNGNSAMYGGHTSFFKMDNSNLANNSYNTYSVVQTFNSSIIGSNNGWGIYGINLYANNTGWVHGTELRTRGAIFGTGKSGYTYGTPSGLIITDQLYIDGGASPASDAIAMLRDCKLVNGYLIDRWSYKPAGGANYKMINLDVNTIDNNTFFGYGGSYTDGTWASKLYLYRQKTIKVTDKDGVAIPFPILSITIGSQTKRYYNGSYQQTDSTDPVTYTFNGNVNGVINTGTGDDVATMILESWLQWQSPLFVQYKYHFIKINCFLTVTASGYETYYSKCDIPKNIEEQITLKPVTKTRYTIEGKPLRALIPESGSSSKLLEL